MKVAIFGSCVSRDSVEFMPEAEVVTYVARHSVTSLESPHGAEGIDLSELTSAFQERMVTNDLHGSGLERIVHTASDLDVVLLDLVDERRGFWEFPDGTTMTNSIEVEFCGAAREARRGGARLIEFGDGSLALSALLVGLRALGCGRRPFCSTSSGLEPLTAPSTRKATAWRSWVAAGDGCNGLAARLTAD